MGHRFCVQEALYQPLRGPSRSSSIAPPKPKCAPPDSSATTRQGIKNTIAPARNVGERARRRQCCLPWGAHRACRDPRRCYGRSDFRAQPCDVSQLQRNLDTFCGYPPGEVGSRNPDSDIGAPIAPLTRSRFHSNEIGYRSLLMGVSHSGANLHHLGCAVFPKVRESSEECRFKHQNPYNRLPVGWNIRTVQGEPA
jgi:hypothetical protein